jgi:hypothetical protein
VPVFVISSSENLIRALIAELEGLDEAEVPLLDIPYATPLVFQFDEALQLVPTSLAVPPMTNGWYLGDAERIKSVQADIRAEVRRTAADGGGPSGEHVRHAKVGGSAAAAAQGQQQAEPAAAQPQAAVSDEDSCFAVGTETGELIWVCPDDPPLDPPPLGAPQHS